MCDCNLTGGCPKCKPPEAVVTLNAIKKEEDSCQHSWIIVEWKLTKLQRNGAYFDEADNPNRIVATKKYCVYCGKIKGMYIV